MFLCRLAGVTKIAASLLDRLRRSARVIGRDIRRTAGRLRYASPAALLPNVARAAALHWRDRPPPLPPPRSERLLVTLTTVPERSARILPTLRSLIDQACPADRILLAWPDRSLRTGALYPAPPRLPDGIEILPCRDEGPASKLLPALRHDPGAVIVVVDDDVVYPRDFLANLLAAHRARPRAALGWRGWQLAQHGDARDFEHVFATGVAAPTRVDVLLGTWGYLIPPAAFDDAIFRLDEFPDELRWVDDVWVSGNLARCGIERFVVPARTFPLETRASFMAALTDTVNRSGRNDTVAIEAFRPWW